MGVGTIWSDRQPHKGFSPLASAFGWPVRRRASRRVGGSAATPTQSGLIVAATPPTDRSSTAWPNSYAAGNCSVKPWARSPAGLPSTGTGQPTKCPPATSIGARSGERRRDPWVSERYGRIASRIKGFRRWRALSAGLSGGGPTRHVGGSAATPTQSGLIVAATPPTDRSSTAWPNSYAAGNCSVKPWARSPAGLPSTGTEQPTKCPPATSIGARSRERRQDPWCRNDMVGSPAA